jgi:hypothetical protein
MMRSSVSQWLDSGHIYGSAGKKFSILAHRLGRPGL